MTPSIGNSVQQCVWVVVRHRLQRSKAAGLAAVTNLSECCRAKRMAQAAPIVRQGLQWGASRLHGDTPCIPCSKSLTLSWALLPPWYRSYHVNAQGPQDLGYRAFSPKVGNNCCACARSFLAMRADWLIAVVQGIHWAAPWLAWLPLTFSATALAWVPWMYPAILLEPRMSAIMHLPGSMMPLCQIPGTSSTTRSSPDSWLQHTHL